MRSGLSFDTGLSQLLAVQCQVATRKQLARHGVDYRVVGAEVDGGRWQRVGDSVVVLHNGPLTYQQQLWVAVRNAGPTAALAARTAAVEGGLRWIDTSTAVEIVVPRGATVPPLAFVMVHESRRFSAADIVTVDGPPRVGIERALVDMALWTPSPRIACAVLATGVQQRLTTARRLLDQVGWPARGRHCRLLRLTLRDIEGGAEALSELDFVAYCRRHDLPQPRRQVVRVDGDGRRRYLDADFDGFSVEIDGGIHLRAINAWADMDRSNALVIMNERQLRFPSYLIHMDDPVVAKRIRQAMAIFGPPDQSESATSAGMRAPLTD